jgi:choline-glycine betaine transporter
LTQYADITAQNLGWIIATGVAVFLLFFFTFIVSSAAKFRANKKNWNGCRKT